MTYDESNNFYIERLYVKELSFKSPQSPEIFLTKDIDPELDLEISTETRHLDTDIHEVSLILSAEACHKDEVFFAVHLEQAGIFVIEGIEEAHLHKLLGAYCPTILFPYAREVISNVVSRAGLPALYLSPVDFEAIYEEETLQGGMQMSSESLH